jgi:hypothetical protein
MLKNSLFYAGIATLASCILWAGVAAAAINAPTVTLPNADTILPTEGGATPSGDNPTGYVVSSDFVVSWNGIGGGTGTANFKVKGPASFINGGNSDTKPANEIWIRMRKPSNNQWENWKQLSDSAFVSIDSNVSRTNDSRTLQICVRASLYDTVNGTNQQFAGTLTWEVQ